MQLSSLCTVWGPSQEVTVELVCRVNPTASAEVTSRCTAAVTLLGFSVMKLLAASLFTKPLTCIMWCVMSLCAPEYDML